MAFKRTRETKEEDNGGKSACSCYLRCSYTDEIGCAQELTEKWQWKRGTDRQTDRQTQIPSTQSPIRNEKK